MADIDFVDMDTLTAITPIQPIVSKFQVLVPKVFFGKKLKKKPLSKAATTDRVWTRITPRIDENLIGTCLNAACDGQFLFNDGVTYYSYAAANINLNHNDIPKSGCIGVSNGPVLEDLACNDPNVYAVCQCSP